MPFYADNVSVGYFLLLPFLSSKIEKY